MPNYLVDDNESGPDTGAMAMKAYRIACIQAGLRPLGRAEWERLGAPSRPTGQEEPK